ALKEISAQNIGSEFGMLTETVVGKDFLTEQRLAEIREKISLHEDNLRRIQELKAQMIKAHVRIEKLPPDKQEIYIGVLRKEIASQAELKSLNRIRERLSKGLSDFLSASIRVVESLYPPVRVQMVDQITEITQRLNAVTLNYDKKTGIVSNFTNQRSEEKP
ncbi:MAG: FapA family protein, partial [Lentisphaerota bacterium]